MRLPSLLRRPLRAAVPKLPFSPSKRFARSLTVHPRRDLVRLGSDYGGHVVAEGLLDERSICYSGGIGDDLSFDLALIDRFGCPVHAFDPTPEAHAYVDRRRPPAEFRLHASGLWSADTHLEFWDHPAERRAGAPNYSATNLYGGTPRLRAPVRSLQSIMGSLGHLHIDLLKLDIEGAEYEVIRSIVEEGIPVNMITIEFHKDRTTRAMREAAAALEGARLFPRHVSGYEVLFVRSPRLIKA